MKDTIALARSERGWTQVEAAGFLGCSQRSFNSWEKGTRKPHSFWMAKLSKFAGVSHEEIFSAWQRSP